MIKVDMTQMRRRFQPGQSSGEPRKFRPASGETSGSPDNSASLAERIVAAHARALNEPPPTHLELGPEQPVPTQATATRIVDAYERALRLAEPDDDDDDDDDDPNDVDPEKKRKKKKKPRDDDQPGDDRPDQRYRGPEQRPIVATAAGIIRAMKLARGEL